MILFLTDDANLDCVHVNKTPFCLYLSFIVKSKQNRIELGTIPGLVQGLHCDGRWIQEVPWRGWSKKRSRKRSWRLCWSIEKGQEVSAMEQVSPGEVLILTFPHAEKSLEQQGHWWKWPFERVCEKGPVCPQGRFGIDGLKWVIEVLYNNNFKILWSFLWNNKRHLVHCHVVLIRREQYYWMRYWYWVILGCFRNIGFGIVKGFSKYWYWVLFRAFQNIGDGIGYKLEVGFYYTSGIP